MRLDDLPFLGELKEEYKELRADGKNRDSTVMELTQSYADELAAQDEDSWIFWVALADAQLACKELTSEVANLAASALDALSKTEYACVFTQTRIKKRRATYQQAPMPEQPQIRIKQKFRCQWKIGDTFAYRLKGEAAESVHISGNYILLRKVDEYEYKGEVQPIVTLTFWGNSRLPNNQQEFLSVPPLKITTGRMNCPEGCYEYRARILLTSKKQVADLSCEYVGNFPDIALQNDEYAPDESWIYWLISPKRLDLECCIVFRNDWAYRTGEILRERF